MYKRQSNDFAQRIIRLFATYRRPSRRADRNVSTAFPRIASSTRRNVVFSLSLGDRIARPLRPHKMNKKPNLFYSIKERQISCNHPTNVITSTRPVFVQVGFPTFVIHSGHSIAPTPQAPIRNCQTRKVANVKVLNRNTNLTQLNRY